MSRGTAGSGRFGASDHQAKSCLPAHFIFRTKARMRVTPPLHRTPHGQGALQNGGAPCNRGLRVNYFSSNPHVDQKVKKQVLDQSWYLQSDRSSTSACTVISEVISGNVTVTAIRW